MNDILFGLFIAVGLINTAHLGAYVAGANIYDIWQFRRSLRKVKGFRKQPFVSIIVPAHNEELVIERCLESIRANRYRNKEVIVHSDKSSDATVKIIRAYQKKYPKFALRVIDRKKQVGKAGGVNFAIQRYAKGSLIMTLDADCVLREDAIKNAVAYFRDPTTVGVAANVRLMDQPTILGILQKFEHMIGYRSKKFYTMTNSEFIVGGVASTYRREILEEVGYYDTDTMTEDIGLSMKIVATGNKTRRIIYGADVVAATEPVHSFKALLKQRYRWKMGSMQNLLKHTNMIASRDKKYSKMLTWYRLPFSFLSEGILLIQPILITYILFLSFQYQTLGFFVGAYFTITIYILMAVWPDEHATVKHKIGMSLYAPIVYFTFYIMDAIQVVSIIRCLINPKQLMRRTAEQSTWVSPARAGQQVEFS
ncbi:MAG TPA: glycosyltransferase [Candidatus Saccharimonadales bacterium]|nr:glycosyltransferase [Candidatus Saccharimonadales bacterium]